jgi:hypothetical protein
MDLGHKRAKRLSLAMVISLVHGIGFPLARAAENLPSVSTIDFYGLRSVTEQEIRARLGIKEGDPAPLGDETKKEAAKRLEKIPHVARAELSTITINGGKICLFVGVEEKDAPSFQYRPTPRGSAVLPREMVEAESQFGDSRDRMLQTGIGNTEDDSQGHALFENPQVRACQQKFIQLAASGVDILREVLKSSADSRQRQIAALILGYAPDKRLIVEDLMDAVRDPDPIVRNNATRSLGAIAVLATRKPELGIQIDPLRFIEMLNSLEWTDRNKAMMVLDNLTRNRPAELMSNLQKQALSSLIEMARWKSDYAYMSFVLIARIAGWEESDIGQALNRGDREKIIAKAARSP